MDNHKNKSYKLLNSRKIKYKRIRLRQSATKSEVAVWKIIRGRRLGYKFRRQYSIGEFIVDFCCPELKLIIELDGETHNNEAAYQKDARRQKYLEQQGFKVLRYQDEYVLDNPEGIYLDLKKYFESI